MMTFTIEYNIGELERLIKERIDSAFIDEIKKEIVKRISDRMENRDIRLLVQEEVKAQLSQVR